MIRAQRLVSLSAAALMALAATVFVAAGAAPASAGVAPVSADPTPSRYPYSNRDVGFSEVGFDFKTPGGIGDHLDRMQAFVPGRTPIIRAWTDFHTYASKDEVTGAISMDFDHLDKVVMEAHRKGMRPLVTLFGSPSWLNGGHIWTANPTQDPPETWLPADSEAWKTLVDLTVQHYGPPPGSPPGTPPIVDAFEVWNEPNIDGFGKYDGVYGDDGVIRPGDGIYDTAADATATLARYWELVKIASTEIHSTCGQCYVLAGGSAGLGAIHGDAARSPSAWLDWGYAHGYKDTFDAVAHHPYSEMNEAPDTPKCGAPWENLFGPPADDTPGQVCGELAALRDVMVRRDDAGKKIWGTEWGYGLITPNPAWWWSEKRDQLVKGVRMWQAQDYTGPLVLFSYRDSKGNPYGIVEEQGFVKKDVTLYDDLSLAFTNPDLRVPFKSQGGIGGYDLSDPRDRVVPFDYEHTGKLDHLLVYRPGTGIVYVLRRKTTVGAERPSFETVFRSTNGIGGFDLSSANDQIISYDFAHTGRQDYLVLYRPGTGVVHVVGHASDGSFWPVYTSTSGIGGYDLASTKDRLVAYDYEHTGKLDHLVAYRPGDNVLFILQHSAAGPFTPVVGSHQGIDGFALTSPDDQVIAYDYAHTGKQDALLLYRPGAGLVTIVGHGAGNTFWPHLISSSGIAGYDLADRRDRIVAFDYAHTGMADHLVVYRPGTGYLDVVRHDPTDTYSAVHVSHQGVGSVGWFDLRNAQDRIVAYDFGHTGSADHLLLYRPGGRAVTIGTR
ncbi:hypothetical protein [Micromonospora hortensis]|uniref:hypothetical protein n=1 Tax=Micromonospora hortensis TaxID=2911209 RepID=UPI001EE81485|nr:hypothetical protein [Micromonospora hortensis]MCG5450589.1 hypothetical protein [Micromonospora hortensis]